MSQKEALELVFQKLRGQVISEMEVFDTWENHGKKGGQSHSTMNFLEVLMGTSNSIGGILLNKIFARNELVQNLKDEQKDVYRFNVDHY